MLENEPTGGERAGTDVPPGDAADSTTPTRRTRAPRRKATPPPAEAQAPPGAEPGAAIEAAAAGDAPAAEAPAAEAPAAPARRRRKAAAAAAPPLISADDPAAVVESLLSDAEPAVAPVKAVRARRTKATRAAAPAAVQPELVQPDPAEPDPAQSEPAPEPTRPEPQAAQPQPVEPEPRPVEPEPQPVESEPVEPTRSVPDAGTTTPVIGVLPLDDEPVVEEAPPTRARRRTTAMPPPVLFMPPEPEPDLAPPARRGRRVPPVEALAPVEPVAEAAEDVVADEPAEPSRRRRRPRRGAEEPAEAVVEIAPPVLDEPDETAEDVDDVEDGAEGELDDDDDSAAGRRRRRRGRRGRGRGKGPSDEDDDEGDVAVDAETDTEAEAETAETEAEAEAEGEADEEGDEPEEVDGVTRRRRRRRRKGAGDTDAPVGTDDGVHTVVRIREPRTRERSDEVQGVSGSTRLEAKRQRRRDGREQRRTRPPILSESEFLARREAVDRVMVVRQKADRTQIAVLEDGVLVEHYVARATSGTMVGNVYLGKVQNVLPSMEAAFVDVGRGRNAVLYAGEVNWDATGLEGRARSIEQALRSGDSVLVQVTKDPMGHKGARLSSHIALSGRHLVYVPNGNASGISRKLPDNERKRLRDILKKMVPDGAGVIVRTAAEGATEDELARDVKRLQAQWEDIQARAADGHAPAPLSEEPDLVIRVVRDLFNEDFRELVVQGEQAYGEVENYLDSVSPDLLERLHRHTGAGDVFAEKRIDEQILKGLDRKVFLPSGGHLVIDRTEAMTVVDVNTGKYTGAGGNLEETVTRNNLEAAEEIVRQLRLRDLGGIVVIDFIDMVLESNRDLVLRRLTECLGRDRTKHQVTEITSLGLVQMTRKRIGAGLLEAFSETCDHCKGRGLMVHTEPVPEKRSVGAGNQVKAVASAPARTEQPAEKAPAGRQRRRRGGADPVEAFVEAPVAEWTDAADAGSGDGDRPAVVADVVPDAVQETGPAAVAAGLPPVGSGVVAPAARTAAADDSAQYDISGYDLSRYESDDDGPATLAAEDAEPLQLTGADDPDAADEDEDDEPVGAGAGARRRSRRGGTRRRTRP